MGINGVSSGYCGPACTGSTSCGVTANLQNGNLVIDGSSADDDINVTQNGDTIDVTANGQDLGSFPADQISDIRVRGHQGNDTINVDVDPGIRCHVRGGRGDDTINVNASDSFVRGGPGQDTINVTGGSNNVVGGGRGTNTINLSDTSGDTVVARAGDVVNNGNAENVSIVARRRMAWLRA